MIPSVTKCVTIVDIQSLNLMGRIYCSIINSVKAVNERLKAKEVVKVIVGESNALIKQHKSELDIMAKGKIKQKGFGMRLFVNHWSKVF